MSEKKHVIIDGSGLEYGNSITCGLLIPYILKKSGNFHVTLYSKIDFGEELRNVMADEFILQLKNRNPEHYEEKNNIEILFNQACADRLVLPEHIESIPFVGKQNPMQEPYVVFIPVVYGHLGEYVHWRTVHALDFDVWEKLKRFVNDKGYKVVGFGTSHSSTKEHLEELSDKAFWFDMGGKDLQDFYNVRHINQMTPFQLEWMYFARTSVSLGGAFHVPMSFTVPGMGWDGQVDSNYDAWDKFLSFKRKDLFYLPHLDSLGRTFKMVNGKENDHKIVQEFLLYIIKNKLEQLL